MEFKHVHNDQFKAIEADLNKRMSHYTDSRHPTDDEARIAWLITYADDLVELINNLIIRNTKLSDDALKVLDVIIKAADSICNVSKTTNDNVQAALNILKGE